MGDGQKMGNDCRVGRVISADGVGLDRKDQTNLRFYIDMEMTYSVLGKAALQRTLQACQ